MKKSILIIGIVLLILIIPFLSVYAIRTAPKDKGAFSVDDYTAYIAEPNFRTERTYGAITDWKTAANIGKQAIRDRFGKSAEGGLFEWMGCDVQYDTDNDTYYVRTYHVNPNVLGGAFDVIIKADGTILAIWGED